MCRHSTDQFPIASHAAKEDEVINPSGGRLGVLIMTPSRILETTVVRHFIRHGVAVGLGRHLHTSPSGAPAARPIHQRGVERDGHGASFLYDLVENWPMRIADCSALMHMATNGSNICS
jgi:hypothetical protein